MITLHHHPYSRASSIVWTLEEVGVPYELRYVDIMKGEQKSPELLKLNPPPAPKAEPSPVGV